MRTNDSSSTGDTVEHKREEQHDDLTDALDAVSIDGVETTVAFGAIRVESNGDVIEDTREIAKRLSDVGIYVEDEIAVDQGDGMIEFFASVGDSK